MVIELTDEEWLEKAEQAEFKHTNLPNVFVVSSRQVRRRVWKRWGCPVWKWLDQMRVLAVVPRLLRGMSVKATAIELGFDSAQSFCTWFKEHFQMTATEFVAQARAKAAEAAKQASFAKLPKPAHSALPPANLHAGDLCVMSREDLRTFVLGILAETAKNGKGPNASPPRP